MLQKIGWGIYFFVQTTAAFVFHCRRSSPQVFKTSIFGIALAAEATGGAV